MSSVRSCAVFLLAAAACAACAGASASASAGGRSTPRAAAAVPPDRVIFVGDCNGGGHIFPNSSYEINVNMRYFQTLAAAFGEGVMDRAKCACPSLTDDDIRTFFLPTLPSFMEWMTTPYAERKRLPTECADAFARKFFGDSTRMSAERLYQSAAFFNLFLPFGSFPHSEFSTDQVGFSWMRHALSFMSPVTYMPWNIGTDVISFLGMPLTVMSLLARHGPIMEGGLLEAAAPASCTAQSVAEGKGCLVSVVEPTTSTRLNVAMDTCPASNLTYTSVSCSGPFCESLGQLCRQDSHCSGGMACRAVTSNDGIVQFLNSVHVLNLGSNGAEKDCGGAKAIATAVVEALETVFLGSTLTGDVDGLQICIPADDERWQDFQHSFYDFPHAESFSMSNIDGARIAQCEGANPDCSVTMVGDGICQTACNVPACMNDGGDCRNLPKLSCPANPRYPSVECSGAGTCLGGSCFCSCRNGGSDCSGCNPPNSRSIPSSDDPYYGYYDYYYYNDDDHDEVGRSVQLKRLFTSGPVKPTSWDGNMGTGRPSVLDPDRKSGHLFTTPPTTMAPAEAPSGGVTPLVYVTRDGALGVSLANPKLGFAFSMPKLPAVGKEMFENLLPKLLKCRAESVAFGALSAFTLFKEYGMQTPVPWMFQFAGVSPSDNVRTLGCGWLFRCPQHYQEWSAGFRAAFPSTCSLSGATPYECKASYSNFASLLGVPDAELYLDWNASPAAADAADAAAAAAAATAASGGGAPWPSAGLAASSALGSILADPKPCTTDDDCGSSGTCVDLAGPTVFNLPTTTDWDPLSFPLFGKHRNSNPTCGNPTAFRTTVRKLLLSLGHDADANAADSSDLRFCFVDVTQFSKRAQAWSKTAVDTSCAENNSCTSNPGAVKGLSSSSTNVAPAAGILSPMVPDALPADVAAAVAAPATAATAVPTLHLSLPGVPLPEGRKLALKTAVADVLASQPGNPAAVPARIFVSAVSSAATFGTNVSLLLHVGAASAAATQAACDDSRFMVELGRALAVQGVVPHAAATPSHFTPSDHKPSHSLAPGITAAIVVAVVVVVVAAVVVVVRRRRRQSRTSNDAAYASMA